MPQALGKLITLGGYLVVRQVEQLFLWCHLAGRAVGITVAGLLLGVLIGGGLQSWLRVDIVPIGVGLSEA